MYEYADGVTELAMKYETYVPRSLSTPENERKVEFKGTRTEGENGVSRDADIDVGNQVKVEVEKEVEVEAEVEVKKMIATESEKEGEKEGEKEVVKEEVIEEPVTGRETSSCHFDVIFLSSPPTSHSLLITRWSILLAFLYLH